MSENNDTSNESNSVGSDTVSELQTSKLAGGGGAGANPLLRSGVLRPSVLGSSMLGTTTPAGGATVSDGHADAKAADELGSCNPFMKDQKDAEEVEEDEIGAVGGESVKGKEKEKADLAEKKKAEEDDEPDERPDPLTLLRKNGIERANLFAAAKNSIPRVEKSGFVFGQNVHERVVGENLNPDSASKPQNSEEGAASGELLFSSVIQNAAKTSDTDGAAAAGKETEVKSLTDVAREYEESRAQKRKYEEVATFTGEENEVNIVDVNCKLFAFVKSNWEERGRGSLRLNDSKNEQECSRVVFRTSGNLRLLLNTKVWAGMVAERPSQKSLRLTAMDNTGKIKIFLVMARPVDINQLHKALVERIDLRKSAHPEECHDAAVSENNGEEAKNGDAIEAPDIEDTEETEIEAVGVEVEAKQATTTVQPEQDDSTEPSPKKSLMLSAEATN